MNKAIMIILDGYGEGEKSRFNAVINAKTPTLDAIKENGYSLLKTDSEAVGLLKGNMGGSEVGHMTIGAGRIVPSMAKKIYDEIETKKFEKNPTIVSMLKGLKENNSDLHLFGLMSDKNIHSDINHLYKIVEIASPCAKNVYIHFVADGRDSGQKDSVKYLKELKKHIRNIKNCQFLSVSGRFYAMDRENNIDRTNMALNAMFSADSGIKQEDVEKYILNEYENNRNDEFILPKHVESKFTKLNQNDYIFIFNFREDRIRQIGKSFEELNCNLITMADVGGVNSEVVYPSTDVNNTLSEYLSQKGLKQIKISESTKYAHVTYFLNGGREQPFENEDRVHVPTIKTNDYAKTPKMQAGKITNEVVNAIKKNYDAIIVNYSNPDMIGHTGNYDATVKSIEFLDKCVKKVLKFAKKHNYLTLITADHGNSEQMKTKQGDPHTAHTLNKVFCSVVGKDCKLKKSGGLIDVAPTFLDLIGLENSKHFEGQSLIQN